MDGSMNEMNETVLARLDALTAQVSYLVERQKKQEELIDELLLPLGKEFLKTATSRFDEFEKKGYFEFGRELVKVGTRIAESYTAEDVRQLGNAVTGILDTVRAMTQPDVLSVVGEATQVIARADQTEPIGLVGMVRATRHHDVQRGMAVMMELLGKLGKGAQVLTEKASRDQEKRARLAAALGPRRTRKALGTERTPAPPRVATKPATSTPRAEALPPPTCTVKPVTDKRPTTVVDGVEFTADGNLADPTVWTRELGEKIAGVSGVALTEQHWAVVEWARKDWEANKASPNIRRITQGMGVATKDLYTLFPKAPGRTIARIAGIPKPAGCV